MIDRDHPRLRGEHREGKRFNPLALGSPPPTRGTPKKIKKSIEDNRITPAYAGNTNYVIKGLRNNKDHPRLRGEHTTFCVSCSIFPGSPPPTRGTP